MPIWNTWMRKKQITHICSGKPEGEEAACTGGFPQDQHEPSGLISPSLSQQDFMSIWCNLGNYRRLQLRSDPLLRSKAWSELGTLLALHWYLSAHMEINKAPTSSGLSATYFPLHSPAITPEHKQNALDNLLTLQLPFYCPTSSCRWVGCQETPGTWVISSGWLQSWLDLLCPLGNKFNTWSSEQCAGLFCRFSAAQLLVRGYFGPSATLSKPAALQNVALFQTIPLPLLSLQC